MRRYVFPFENVKKDSNIVIYGAGNVGNDYLDIVRKTGYCNILKVLDRNKAGDTVFGFEVTAPETIRSVNSKDYETVLIAIENERIQREITEYLIQLGVPQDKISVCDRKYYSNYNDIQELTIPDDGGDVFRCAVEVQGGLGDFLIASSLLIGLRKAAPYSLSIDCYCANPSLVPFCAADRVMNTNELQIENYDAVFGIITIYELYKFSPSKAKRLVPGLCDYFDSYKTTDINEHMFGFYMYNIMLQHMVLRGKHYTERANLYGLLPYDREFLPMFPIDPSAHAVLNKNDLTPKEYIAISTVTNKVTPLKLWPKSHWVSLVSLLKNRYPRLKIVVIGDRATFEIPDIDLNLQGSTTISEAAVLLKHSLLFIGSEGGMTNLNHFVSGKSVCLFGPTNHKIYAYSENINLRKRYKNCYYGCERLIPNDFRSPCSLYGGTYAPCMKAITPDYVEENVTEYIDNLPPTYEYTLTEKIPVDDLVKLFDTHKEAALINRKHDDYVIQLAHKLKGITIYDYSLADNPNNPATPTNAGYYLKLKNINISAEYGVIHNIPSLPNKYDLVMNFTFQEEEQQGFALMELLRITKQNGKIIVTNDEGSLSVYKKSIATEAEK